MIAVLGRRRQGESGVGSHPRLEEVPGQPKKGDRQRKTGVGRRGRWKSLTQSAPKPETGSLGPPGQPRRGKAMEMEGAGVSQPQSDPNLHGLAEGHALLKMTSTSVGQWIL